MTLVQQFRMPLDTVAWVMVDYRSVNTYWANNQIRPITLGQRAGCSLAPSERGGVRMPSGADPICEHRCMRRYNSLKKSSVDRRIRLTTSNSRPRIGGKVRGVVNAINPKPKNSRSL